MTLANRPEKVDQSKHQCSQENAEHQDDEEDHNRNEEQDFGDPPGAGGYSGETKETSNERNEKENDGPFDHEEFLLRGWKNARCGSRIAT
jgi:hypothetical protein